MPACIIGEDGPGSGSQCKFLQGENNGWPLAKIRSYWLHVHVAVIMAGQDTADVKKFLFSVHSTPLQRTYRFHFVTVAYACHYCCLSMCTITIVWASYEYIKYRFSARKMGSVTYSVYTHCTIHAKMKTNVHCRCL